MLGTLRSSRYGRRSRGNGVRLQCEALETRDLLSAVLPTLPEMEINDTLSQAQNLGDPGATGGLRVVGAIGNSPAGASDVDWYCFALSRPTEINLSAGDASFSPVLSLYNSDALDIGDPYDPLGHRLLAQDDGADHGGPATLDARLAAGTYYVAVSGSGNRFFYPFLAASGTPGSTGPYELLLQTTDLNLGPQDGPVLLETDPAAGVLLNRSPFVIRADFSTALDPASVRLGQDVRLLYSPDGDFAVHGSAVGLARSNLNPAGNELQLFPAAPLRMGYYELVLAGSRQPGRNTLRGADGLSLGQSPDHTAGQDFTTTFIVGGGAADDTPATAHALGDLTNAGVQVTGALGDDPTDPLPFNPADVDLYHFTISGPGRYALTAEVFAGRIGSPLDPALSLFVVGTDRRLHLVAANDNTGNVTLALNGSVPLFTDPVLAVGLTAGDYYLAVSGSPNVPNPDTGLLPGTNGVFDPTISHSGRTGFTTGPYVLDLGVQADDAPPQVLAVTPSDGNRLNAPPTRLVVQFSEPVNLGELAYTSFEQTSQSSIRSVFVQAADGTRYYPRLESWDGTNSEATFLMLDGLANGDYELHLSGSLGLADYAGNALVGNDPSGDFVVRFQVAGPARGTGGNPLLWTDQEPNDTLGLAQQLGVLFPNELHAGVTIARSTANLPGAPGDTADEFQFQVLQSRVYYFNLSGTLPAGTRLTLFDGAGNVVPAAVIQGGRTLKAVLNAGTYVLQVGSWTPGQSGTVAYQVWMTLGGVQENPTPLTTGPAPVLRIRLADVSWPGVLPSFAPSDRSTPAASAPSAPAIIAVPTGTLWVLGVGPLGSFDGSESDGAAATPARLSESFPGRPLLSLIRPAQAGRADEIAAANDFPIEVTAFMPWSTTESRPPLVPMTDAESAPPVLVADAGTEATPAESLSSPVPARQTVHRKPAQVAALPVGDAHDAWLPMLAAIATYAAILYRRAPTDQDALAAICPSMFDGGEEFDL
jgi:hypothetical protein